MVDVMQDSGGSDCVLGNFKGSGGSGLLLVPLRHRAGCSGICSVVGYL